MYRTKPVLVNSIKVPRSTQRDSSKDKRVTLDLSKNKINLIPPNNTKRILNTSQEKDHKGFYRSLVEDEKSGLQWLIRQHQEEISKKN